MGNYREPFYSTNKVVKVSQTLLCRLEV